MRKDHMIVDKGLNGILRYPAYAVYFLSFFGLAVYFANWLAFVVICISIFYAFPYRIKIEEESLIAQFGKKYLAYIEKTKLLIPFIW